MDTNNNDDSKIGQFYKDKSIFVTGATGFMGKVLVHKLLVSCSELEKIYVLIRAKKGQLPEERLASLLNAELFRPLKEAGSPLLQKVQVVQGDITLPKLGMSDQDLETVIEKVSIIFHSAATVRFEEELNKSVGMNVEATKSMVEMAKKMQNLEVFLHVSTAYAYCTLPSIEEKFYPSVGIDPDEAIKKSHDFKLERSIIGQYPNTYTFTKALTENLLEAQATDLPLVIIRPSIVVAAWKEPVPGWVDNYNGPTGMIAWMASGTFRTMLVSREKVADLMPVDVAINLMIVAAWHKATQEQKLAVPIYNVTSGFQNPLTWGNVEEWGLQSILKYPFDKIIWYPGCTFKKNAVYDRLCRYAFHYVPALIMDSILTIMRKPRYMIRMMKKMTVNIETLQYFSTNEWSWSSKNYEDLRQELVKADCEQSLKTFDFDMRPMDWKNYWDDYILGIRHIVQKDKPETLPSSRQKLKMLHVLHFVMQIVFAFFLYYSFFLMF